MMYLVILFHVACLIFLLREVTDVRADEVTTHFLEQSINKTIVIEKDRTYTKPSPKGSGTTYLHLIEEEEDDDNMDNGIHDDRNSVRRSNHKK